MDNLTTILFIGTGATFVCLFLVKRKAVRTFLAFLLIMFLAGIAITVFSR